MSFKFHIDNLVTKLRQKIGFLYRNKSCFPAFCKKTIIEATFLSVLDYGDTIYRIATPSTLRHLDTVYHSALRWVTGDSYGTHHCTLYENAGLSSLSERRDKHWYIFIFKAISGMVPSYICSMLVQNPSLYQTRSSDFLTLKVPFANSELGKAAFSVRAPSDWNELQKTLKIRSLPSLGQFREMISSTSAHQCNCF